MDYRYYQMTRREQLRCVVEAAALTGIAAFCFYDSLWAGFSFPFICFWHIRQRRLGWCEKRRTRLQLQFKEAMQAMAAALAAGYSIENSIREARKDLLMLGEGNEDMQQELFGIQCKLEANATIEEVFLDLAQRSGLEEIELFAEVFAVGKRSGGNMVEVLRDTAKTIAERVETKHQVALVLASRRYEQKIMTGMPIGIVLYLRICCPGFLDPLYHNAGGICMATACLGLYLFAWYLERQFLKIEV